MPHRENYGLTHYTTLILACNMAGNINCNTALIIGLNITLNEIKFKGAIVRHFCFPILSNPFLPKNMSYLISSGKIS